MNITGKNNLWIGLFTHLDSVTRASLELLLQLKGMGFVEQGKEYFVPESKFKTLNKLIKNREIRVGGNAGNAAYFLGKLGIECVLSSPLRPPKLMNFFEKLPVYFYGVRKKTAETAKVESDPNYEHVIIELFKPLSEEGRTIISWDPISKKGLLDSGFWEKMKKGIFLVSGFHLIEKKSAIDKIINKLKTKNVKTYLEIGEPNKSMKYALDRLIEEDLVNHIGMNERESEKLFGIQSFGIEKISKEIGCGMTIHTPDYTISTNKKMMRPVIDIVEAWSMGNPTYYKQVVSLPLKRVSKGLIPTRSLPYLAKLTGLGDAFSALDAIRIFQPNRMEKLIRAIPFYNANNLSPKI